MSQELDALLARVADQSLRADLQRQIDLVRAKRSFGLVFESHMPERVRLPSHPLRRGSTVVHRDGHDERTWTVDTVHNKKANIVREEEESTAVAVSDLVVVAEFGEPIYPGLRQVGSIGRGGDKPAHVVINGENHHALEALQFTHAGKVDCIYIDPPYNTGARDWKYDNDYVDGDDVYRHSKWLAFMERRLRLAKDLMNPDDSVLIVAIDEKEYLRLGMLLGQVFAGHDIQMVAVVTNRAGSPRAGRFARVDEYLFFVYLGDSQVSRWRSNMLVESERPTSMPNVWFSAIRVGSGSALRTARPRLFYPVHIDSESGDLHSVGKPLDEGADRTDYEPPAGTLAMWPLSTEGREQSWRFSHSRMLEYFAAGTARLGRRDQETGTRPITYLRPGTLKNIEAGVYKVAGRTTEGVLELELAEGVSPLLPPSSVWNLSSHYARDYGSKLNSALIPGRSFPYPKSLYAVEDAIRFVVNSKPEATVLDFFAGSGTTTHAVARLNRQDGGQRQSILVTNNQVSAEEAKALGDNGHKPGDAEWEQLGIFEHITRPRVTAAMTGLTPNGEPIKGDYKFTDEFPMSEGFEENVEFFELTYQDGERVELDLAFEAIAPLLWLRAGAAGPIVTDICDSADRRVPYEFGANYAVLLNPDRWRSFIDRMTNEIRTVFIVTDSTTTFASVAAELPPNVEPVRLYRNYLSTFEINRGLGE